MTKHFFIFFLFLTTTSAGFTQNLIEWSSDYKLTLDDFKSKAHNTGQMQIATGSFSVTYEMGGINLITTRNLNKNVTAIFQKSASYIDKGNAESTERLLEYQQLIFNLYELQARNLRQKFFTERKRLLTQGPSVLHQAVLADHNRLLSEIENDTFHGSSSAEITKWNAWILTEIEKLKDFCKDCKPSKKKKKKR